MATHPITSKPAKAGGALTVVGIVVTLIGIAMLATVAMAAPGVIVLIAGVLLTTLSYFTAKVMAKEPRA